jgi:hypothetical protein
MSGTEKVQQPAAKVYTVCNLNDYPIELSEDKCVESSRRKRRLCADL